MARQVSKRGVAGATVVVRLTGAPCLVTSSGERALERKIAGMLAYVAAHGPCKRATLAALLWPDATGHGARNNLRQALFKLKKTAGVDIVTGSETLSAAAGVHFEGVGEETLLADCAFDDCTEFETWLAGERARVTALRTTALAEQAQAREAAGDFDGALRCGLDLVAIAPLAEEHHRLVMRLHYLRGDRAAALSAYEACVERLRRELATDPSAETRALAATFAQESAPKRRAPGAVPVTLMRPPRMIGRDRELAAIEDAWNVGRTFVLLGEAGLGKSRLASEFAAHGKATMVSARPGDASVPYAAFARLLRAVLEGCEAKLDAVAIRELGRLLPELRAELPPGEPDRGTLQRVVARVLREAVERRTRGFILDDLHFADAASIEMLDALADDEALRWGFTQRPAEGLPEAHTLRTALGERWKLESVTLASLSEAQLAQFVDSLGIDGVSGVALAPQLLKATGGNPQFALETLKSALGSSQPLDGASPLPRPPSVGSLIERRLALLSAPALALARVAAVAGGDFDAEIAARVLETPALALADSWRELEAAQVLRDSAFAHDLIYEATLRGVPGPIARHAHGVIAAHMAGRSGEPARVAEHWIAAGEPGRAVPFLKEAAVRAEMAARFGEARALLERGIDITRAAGLRSDCFGLCFILIELLKDIGDQRDVLRIIEAMHAEAATLDQRLRLARAEVQGIAYTGAFDRAIELGMGLLEDRELMEEASPQRELELRYAVGDSLIAQRRARAAGAMLEPIEAGFREHPEAQFRGWYFADLARVMLATDRIPEAERHLATALDCAREVGRNRMTAGVLLFSAQVASAAGRLAEPVERIREAQLLIADMEDSMLARVFNTVVGEFLFNQGRFREAIEVLDLARASKAATFTMWQARSFAVSELAFAQMGDPARARQMRADCEKVGSSGPLRAVLLAFRIESMLLLGERIEEALRDFEQSNVEASQSAQWRCEFWKARAGLENPRLERFETIAAAAQQAGLMGHAIEAHAGAARIASREGHGAATLRNARYAFELLRRHTMPSAYRPALWLACHDAVRPFDVPFSKEILAEATTWIKTVVRFQVPEDLREAFLRQNRVNRTLLEIEMLQGGPGPR